MLNPITAIPRLFNKRALGSLVGQPCQCYVKYELSHRSAYDPSLASLAGDQTAALAGCSYRLVRLGTVTEQRTQKLTATPQLISMLKVRGSYIF